MFKKAIIAIMTIVTLAAGATTASAGQWTNTGHDRSYIDTPREVVKHGGFYLRVGPSTPNKLGEIRVDYYDTRWGGEGTFLRHIKEQIKNANAAVNGEDYLTSAHSDKFNRDRKIANRAQDAQNDIKRAYNDIISALNNGRGGLDANEINKALKHTTKIENVFKDLAYYAKY